MKQGAGIAGFDLTKLGSDGSALIIQNGTWSDSGSEVAGTKWSCVLDNHTGLVWEVKTNDGGIHDKDNTYAWGGITAIGHGHADRKGEYYDANHIAVIVGDKTAWDSLVNGSNNDQLCGYSDWRVPDSMELISAPNIDTDYFPNNQGGYWSSSPGYGPWIEAKDQSSRHRSSSRSVRLVRSGQ